MATTLVILAAGIASRYGGPKQLEPMGPPPGGATILDYAIYDARRAGFGDVVLVVRPETELAFRDAIGARWQGKVAIAYAHQRVPAGREKPWGTSEAVLAAKDHIRGEAFAVANADDFYGRKAFVALAEFLGGAKAASSDFALVGYPLWETLSEAGGVNRGVCRTTADGWLESIEEVLNIKRSGQDGVHEGFGLPLVIPGDTPVSMNLWGFTPALFPHLEKAFERFRRERGADPKAEFLLPSLIQELIRTQRARVRVLPAGEHWCGVTYPADKPRVEAALRALVEAGEYPAEPWR